MPSASFTLLPRRLGAFALVVVAAGPLAGCTTTQHKAQRLQLNAARLHAGLEPTRVTTTNRDVRPSRVAVVRDGHRSAFVVTIHNGARKPVSDLPISVGYRLAGKQVYLNAAAGLQYFQAHLPAVRPGHDLTWVFEAPKSVPAGARPFARIGAKPSAPGLVTVAAAPLRTTAKLTHGGLHVHITNLTGIPQYQLQVYAYTTRDGRYSAAGNETVRELDPGLSRSLKLPLVGRDGGGAVHVQAIPTILQ